VLKTEGNLNNQYGLPLTLLRLRPEDRFAVLELGMSDQDNSAVIGVLEVLAGTSLLEGDTPLIYACHISSLLGKGVEVYLKYEGLNPTGSFKDRGMTVAISKAMEEGSKAVICASTGNTSASPHPPS
jgi:threonine synthase